jgi:hypothetical protein
VGVSSTRRVRFHLSALVELEQGVYPSSNRLLCSLEFGFPIVRKELMGVSYNQRFASGVPRGIGFWFVAMLRYACIHLDVVDRQSLLNVLPGRTTRWYAK